MPQVGAFKGFADHSLTINHGVFNRNSDITVAINNAPASLCTNTGGCNKVELSSGTQTFHTENGIKSFTATADSSGTTFTFELDGTIDQTTISDTSIVITTLGGKLSTSKPTISGNTVTTTTTQVIPSGTTVTGAVNAIGTSTSATPIVASSSATVTDEDPTLGKYLIYETTSSYTGNLVQYDVNNVPGTALGGADNICNTDTNKPLDDDLGYDAYRVYGAMIITKDRYVCIGPYGALEPYCRAHNWVMQSQKPYYNPQRLLIQETGILPVFRWAFHYSISMPSTDDNPPTKSWSGMTTPWTYLIDRPNNCEEFTKEDWIGWLTNPYATMIETLVRGGVERCTVPHSLICVTTSIECPSCLK